MYKQTYKIESGKIEFVGEPIEVHKKVEYVVNSGLTRTKFNVNFKKEDKNMANAKDCPKCLEKINALIANKDSKFEEADREWLLTQEESVLDKFAPVVKTVEKIVEKTVEVNKLTAEDQAALNYGKKQLAENRSKMIKGIQANTKEIWTDEKLKGMDDDTLESIYKSVKKEEEVSYELNGGAVVNHARTSTEEPLYPAGVVIEVKK